MKTDKISVKNLLKQHNIRPNKIMGQNFLIDEGVVDQMIKAANLSKKDVVLEVGPGLGGLTEKLAQKAKKVIAVEKDKRIIEVLKETLKNYENVEIVHGDILNILETTFAKKAISAPKKIVANIPYYLTSHLVRKLLESGNPPQTIILLMQKEVAERICPPRRARSSGEAGAIPPKMNLLAVSVQIYSHPEILYYIPKQSFWPKPKVDSAIIKISNIQKPRGIDIKKFFKLVKAGFSSPRKQLANNLSKKLRIDKEETKKALIELGFDAQIRAERLTVNDWAMLLAHFTGTKSL
ncbi:MAG: 16S rRNA (adenine(1518)-N(6)/adenine(1519)-N(6))-dimethyltransferase RsmA [Patescibacteria group bacterium]|nr:16S rRNA (adenine(1518)-N(6)/adenine(1519)-N(6))-dimethyltransferase RsmA [Patescibacteria group bacterium]